MGSFKASEATDPRKESVAEEAFAVEILALANLTAAKNLGRAGLQALVIDLATALGLGVLRNEGHREPSDQDHQGSRQLEHLFSHRILL
jgi:hypothetical protein